MAVTLKCPYVCSISFMKNVLVSDVVSLLWRLCSPPSFQTCWYPNKFLTIVQQALHDYSNHGLYDFTLSAGCFVHTFGFSGISHYQRQVILWLFLSKTFVNGQVIQVSEKRLSGIRFKQLECALIIAFEVKMVEWSLNRSVVDSFHILRVKMTVPRMMLCLKLTKFSRTLKVMSMDLLEKQLLLKVFLLHHWTMPFLPKL